MIPPLVTETTLEGLERIHQGKVRDVYSVDEGHLLLVATDRVSAFDCVLSPGIPYKGAVLTSISAFWFERLRQEGHATHFVTTAMDAMPDAVKAHAAVLEGRATLVKRAQIIPVECIVRGYLAGSAVKEYEKSGTVGFQAVKEGLVAGDRLPGPLFTPTTKAATGHDEPITLEQLKSQLGPELSGTLHEMARAVYRLGSEVAEAQGLILVDTKVEIGRDADGRLMLCDEVLTADSSRYWLKEAWRPGLTPEPLDKQVVRNHLLSRSWDRRPPAPPLPPDVVIETAARYLRLHQLLTGEALPT